MTYYKSIITDLKSRDLYRQEKVLTSIQDVQVTYDHKPLHLMGSNNYLSLNGHPSIVSFSQQIMAEYGTGAGGSRLTTGSTDWHEKLENKLATFKSAEDALVFGSGYMANLGGITSLTGRDSHVFSDRDNHASIVDGLILSGSHFTRYKHLDYKDLEKQMKMSTRDRKIIITDTVFSMDGSMADLKQLGKLAKKYKALLIVDDAHGLGVLGDKGQGLAYVQKQVETVDLTIGSLSKALPGSGGYVTGSKLFIDIIRNKARSYIYSTALPAHLMAAAYKGLELIEEASDRRTVLKANIDFFVNRLRKGGFDQRDQLTPIIPILIGPSDLTLDIQDRLLEDSIYIPGIRPPTVKRNCGQLRASINYNHTFEQLDYIASRIIYHCQDHGIV